MAGRDLGSAGDQMAENTVLEEQPPPPPKTVQSVLRGSWSGLEVFEGADGQGAIFRQRTSERLK